MSRFLRVQQRNLSRTAIVAVSLLSYLVGTMALLWGFDSVAPIPALIPVVVVAWIWGLRAGLPASLIALPAHALLVSMIGGTGLFEWLREGARIIASLVLPGTAIVVGLLSDMRSRFRDRRNELEEKLRLLRHEVSGRKRAEDAAREAALARMQSEQQFLAAFEGSSIGMAIMGLDGRFGRANGACRKFLGYSDEELKELTFEGVTFPADVEASKKAFGRLAGGEIGSLQIEKRYLHKGGRVVWGSLNVAETLGADGKATAYIAQI